MIAYPLAIRAQAAQQPPAQQPQSQQSPSPPSPSSQPPASADAVGPLALDRIRAGLLNDSTLLTAPEGPTFKTEVTGHVIELKDYWLDDASAVSSRVQLTVPWSHIQFQQMWRSPVGNTGRPPFQSQNPEGPISPIRIFPADVTWMLNGGVSAVRGVRGAMRERERKGVKKRIQEELSEIEAARGKPPPAATPAADPPVR